MNFPSRIATLAILIGFLIPLSGFSQTEFNPKVGVNTWSIKDEMEQSGQSSHSGQSVGFDMYIIDHRFLFVPGFHYRRLSILNQEDGFTFEIPKRNGVHYFAIPITFGMKVIEIPAFSFSLMAGGEANFYYNLDANDLELDDDRLHGVFASLTGVAQVEVISFLTLDLKYHHALHPIIKARPESKLRGWTLALGVKF